MYFLRLSHALALNSLVEREYECKKSNFGRKVEIDFMSILKSNCL